MVDARSVSDTNIEFLDQEEYEEHKSLFLRYFVATGYFIDNNKEKRINWWRVNNVVTFGFSLANIKSFPQIDNWV